MLFRDGSAILLKDASNKENPRYEDLLASPTYDIWSFGVMLFEALGWKALFEVCELICMIEGSQHQLVSPPQQANNSDNLSDAREMGKLLKWNLSQLDFVVSELRITLREPSHTCHRETALRACDLIAWLLHPAPADRPQSFDDVLAHSFFAGASGTWRMSDVYVRLAVDRTIAGVDDRHVRESRCKSKHPLGKSLLHVAALEMEPVIVQKLIGKLPSVLATEAHQATFSSPTSPVNSQELSFGDSQAGPLLQRSQQIGAGEDQLDLLDDSGNSPLHALLGLRINEADASKCLEVCQFLAEVTDPDLKNSAGKTVLDIGCDSESSAINYHFNNQRDQRYTRRRGSLFLSLVASEEDGIVEPWGLRAQSHYDHSERHHFPSFHEWLSKRARNQATQEKAEAERLEACANEKEKKIYGKRAETARFRRNLLASVINSFNGYTALDFLANCVQISSKKLPTTFVEFNDSEGPLTKPSFFEEQKVPSRVWKQVMNNIVRFLGGAANVAYYKALLESCDRRTLLTDYRFERVLGAGSFGQVSLCSNRHSESQSAIKMVMPKGGENSVDFRKAQSETELQQRGSTCEYITKIFAWGIVNSAILWVSMEHCDLGELSHYIEKDKGLVTPQTRVVDLSLRNRCAFLLSVLSIFAMVYLVTT